MEKERIFGRIFLPETPGVEIEAWLTISDKQILLEAAITPPRSGHWPLLLGNFNGLDRVTFVSCYPAGGVDVGAGGSFRRIKVSYYIANLYVSNLSELKFSKVTLTSPALAEWTQERGVIEKVEKNHYSIPEHEEILNIDIEDFSIVINNAHFINHSFRELHVRKGCTVSFWSKDVIHLNEFARAWRHLKKLILFLTNKNPEFDQIFLFDKDEEYELINVKDEVNDNKFSQGIEINYRQIFGVLNTVVKNWFGHKKLQPIIDLVLEKLLNTQLSSQGFFLNVCVALETFNDHFLENDPEGIMLRKANRDKIIALIEDKKLLTWFQENSSYWMNPTLKEKLTAYAVNIEFIMGNVFEGHFDTSSFIASIVKTRNGIAHRGEYQGKFNYYELFLAGKVIEFTMRLEILKLLGIDVTAGDRPLLKEAKKNLHRLAYLNNYNQEKRDSKS